MSKSVDLETFSRMVIDATSLMPRDGLRELMNDAETLH